MDAIRNAVAVAIFAAFVAAFVLLASRQNPPQTQAGRAVDGLVNSGMVLSVERGDTTTVTVPDSWAHLQPSARRTYLTAVWDSASDKRLIRVVDEAGNVVEEFDGD